MGIEDGHQGLDDTGRGVELPAALALGAGEHSKEVFIDLTQHVPRFAGIVTKADGGHQIDQLAELAVGQLGARITLVQDALELGVFGLDDGKCVVYALADVALFGGGAQALPACSLRHPEDVDLTVIVTVFQFSGQELGCGVRQEVVVSRVGEPLREFGATGGKGVRDVLDEDEAQHKVLVFGSVHIGAQLVGCGPERLLDVVDHAVESRFVVVVIV